MKNSALILLAGLCAAANLAAQKPAVASVLNVASYTYPGLPGAAIAQGSLFVVFGTNLGPASLQHAPALPIVPALAGTAISVTVNGTTTAPLMVYTSANQLCALLPSNTPVGAGTLTVTYNSQTSATAPITVAATSVGIFSANQAGSGPGVVTTTGYLQNSLTASAAPGDIEIIWATGLGAVGASGNEAAGTAPLGTAAPAPKVYVGGVSANIVSAARSGSPGLDQIAFTVPPNVSGCRVPVVVQTGNVVSNFVTMAIGLNKTCSDPLSGPTPIDLTRLQQQGTVAIGGLDLTRTTTTINIPGFTLPPTVSDTGSASFNRFTFQQYTNANGGLNALTYGACTVFTFQGSNATPVNVVQPAGLDAGVVTVDGPGGKKTLTKILPGSYSSNLGGGTAGPLYLSPGTYTVAGSGGADVGAFSTTVNLPVPQVWTNASAISTVTRANGQPITWTGGDPDGDTYISGYSSAGSGETGVGASFYCSAKTSAGQFTVPALVLLSLPATSVNGLGVLGVISGTSLKQFTAQGLDIATIQASFSAGQTAVYN